MISFDWEKKSFWARCQEGLYLTKSSAQILSEKLDKNQPLALVESIAYLSSYPHQRLQNKIENIFNSCSEEEAIKKLESVANFSLDQNRLKMLDTCQKIISLEVMKKIFPFTYPIKLAQQEALLAPKATTHFERLSQSIKDYAQSNTGYWGKLTRYFGQTVLLSYSLDIENVPKNQWEASAQVSMVRNVINDVIWITEALLEKFNSYLKVAAIGLMALASFLAFVFGCALPAGVLISLTSLSPPPPLTPPPPPPADGTDVAVTSDLLSSSESALDASVMGVAGGFLNLSPLTTL
jgi:hypothetical protein